MRKKKETYSLTSKQRKELRRGADMPAKPLQSDETSAPVNAEGEAVAPAQRKLWVPLLCIVLSLVLILGGVLLAIFVPKTSSKYPRAVITLSDGRTMTLSVWEEECPLAATNFIFLAKIGYFDGVMIHDVSAKKHFMRFGSYPSYISGEERYKDVDFVSSIPKSIFNVVNVEHTSDRQKAESAKFGYRLHRDTAKDASRYSEPYVLSYNYDTAPDFIVNLGENNQNFTNKKGTSFRSNLVAFAKFEDEESQRVLDDIYALTNDPAAVNENTGGDTFVGLTNPLFIKSVKVDNLNKKKWKKFEFISYMNKARDGASAFRSWVGSY